MYEQHAAHTAAWVKPKHVGKKGLNHMYNFEFISVNVFTHPIQVRIKKIIKVNMDVNEIRNIDAWNE